MNKNSFFLILFFVSFYKQSIGQIDINHYKIDLNIDKANQTIQGNTTLTLSSTQATNEILLDLEGLNVDSVFLAGNMLNYSLQKQNLLIKLTNNLTLNKLYDVTIYYHGKPIKDSLWGGFYFNGEYAYNLGVAFYSNPHNYGRVWFPCRDNFTDRATYEFLITVNEGDMALCNGSLISETKIGNKVQYHWKLDEPIPTYLASVAVAPYTLFKSKIGNNEVTLAAVVGDSLKAQQSFENLESCFKGFEENYGEHSFNRIGFNLVPFNSGAMEHATNIAYPRFAADGSKARETLMAHELSHHWWGNTVTCRDATQMWLNEGWASYSEALFIETVYGKKAYRDYVHQNHYEVLRMAHLRDEKPLPVSGISHENTYGMHVYNKGADVIHCLRSYMGDDLFFNACKSFLKENKFTDISTLDLKNHFQNYTNKDLNEFFNNWILREGFADFILENYTSFISGSVYKNKAVIRQITRFTQQQYSKVPLKIMLLSANNDTIIETIEMGAGLEVFEFESPFEVTQMILDPFNEISMARTVDEGKIISGTRSLDVTLATLRLTNNLSKEASYRVEHHWVGAHGNDQLKKLGLQISRDRYWKINLSDDLSQNSELILDYDGSEPEGIFSTGYVDTDLIKTTEDSLFLVYRPNGDSHWQLITNFRKVMGSKFDRKGKIFLEKPMNGDYALAIQSQELLSKSVQKKLSSNFKFYPNPSGDEITIEFDDVVTNHVLEITNLKGELIDSIDLTQKEKKFELSVREWANGIYFIGISNNKHIYSPKKFIKR